MPFTREISPPARLETEIFILRPIVGADVELDTNEHFEQQVRLFEGAGLHLRFRIAEQAKPGQYLAYM